MIADQPMSIMLQLPIPVIASVAKICTVAAATAAIRKSFAEQT